MVMADLTLLTICGALRAGSTNALLGTVLDTRQLLGCCLVAEAKVAGRHLDNIAPCLLGGLTLVLDRPSGRQTAPAWKSS